MVCVDNLYPLGFAVHLLLRAHMLMHLHDDHVDDVSLHTYIHKYRVFLVVTISVGLTQACPN